MQRLWSCDPEHLSTHSALSSYGLCAARFLATTFFLQRVIQALESRQTSGALKFFAASPILGSGRVTATTLMVQNNLLVFGWFWWNLRGKPWICATAVLLYTYKTTEQKENENGRLLCTHTSIVRDVAIVNVGNYKHSCHQHESKPSTLQTCTFKNTNPKKICMKYMALETPTKPAALQTTEIY